MNEIVLIGDVVKQPEFSHETHGKTMYEVYVAPKRLSGTTDEIKCIVPENLVEDFYANRVGALGEIRVRFSPKAKNKMEVYVQVKSVFDYGNIEDCNMVNVSGWVADKMPTLRQTSLGKVISDLCVVSERAENRKKDYLHCLVWGNLAFESWDLQPGDKVEIGGRLQRRSYTKRLADGTVEERYAYEISVHALIKEEDMKKICNECVSCGVAPCLGDSCSNRNVERFYCDECKREFDANELYITEDGDLCAECTLKLFEKVSD